MTVIRLCTRSAANSLLVEMVNETDKRAKRMDSAEALIGDRFAIKNHLDSEMGMYRLLVPGIPSGNDGNKTFYFLAMVMHIIFWIIAISLDVSMAVKYNQDELMLDAGFGANPSVPANSTENVYPDSMGTKISVLLNAAWVAFAVALLAGILVARVRFPLGASFVHSMLHGGTVASLFASSLALLVMAFNDMNSNQFFYELIVSVFFKITIALTIDRNDRIATQLFFAHPLTAAAFEEGGVFADAVKK